MAKKKRKRGVLLPTSFKKQMPSIFDQFEKKKQKPKKEKKK